MDQNAGAQRAKGSGFGGQGSVKRARERMNARLDFGVSDTPPNPRQQQGGEVPRYPGRRQGPIPAALRSKTNPPPSGATISRPQPAPQNYQWPFLDNNNNSTTRLPLDPSRSSPRGPPPQRPPRPNYVPLLLDPNMPGFSPGSPARPSPKQVQSPQRQDLQVTSPSPRAEAYYEEDSSFQSPNAYRDSNPDSQYSSDRPLTTSSTGSIPDFPVPALPIPSNAPPRKIAGGGPPPAMRRGPSSYYSQASFVSPIPEEMPEAMRASGSYASSNPIASSWGSHPDDMDMNFIDEIEEEEDEDRAGSAASQHSESANLVRQASLGKKARPRLTTVGSQDDKRQDSDTRGLVPRGLVVPGAAGGITAAGLGSRKDVPQNRPLMPQFPSSSDETASLEDPSTESDIQAATVAASSVPLSRSRTVMASPTEPQAARIAGFDRTSTGMSERIPETLRPPKLDLDAKRDLEARGSLTSLSDLIRRATKVATNLERGRTASRLGLADFLNAEKGERDSISSDSKQKRRSGSVSDILASFPAPSVLTPTGERPVSRWPSPYRGTNLQQQQNYETLPRARSDEKFSSPDEKRQDRKGRRCCGMRLWVFLLILLVILVLVAAAVVVPVVLIVLPREHNNNAAAANSASSCQKIDPCMNGGVSTFTSNACRCICINGFTGPTCGTALEVGCSSITENLGTNNQASAATVGNSIPRLLSAASTNFSISLDNQEILSLFSSANLSCDSENALVTFNGQNSKRFFILPEINQPEYTEDVAPIHIEKRQIENVLVRRDTTLPIATTDGIVYEAAATTAAADVSATSTPTATITSSAAASTTSSPSGLNITQDLLDFSSLAVLFIFEQTETLSEAIYSQKAIQTFLYTGTSGTSNTSMNMNSGSTNFTLNFVNFTITLGNGTNIGGRGDGNGGLLSATNSTAGANISDTVRMKRWNVLNEMGR